MAGIELIGQLAEDIGQLIGISEDASELSGGFATLTQGQAQQNLTSKKVKLKDDPEDAKRVIKGSDVVKCVETTLNGTTLSYDTLRAMARALVGQPAPSEAWGQQVANEIIACVRKKYLKQTNKEVAKDGKHRTRKV